jgi:protocatechuate 3,4-dioxygenase beta subunit
MTDLSHLDSIADDPVSITEAVVKAMSNTEDERLKQIVGALVRHAHAFFREVQLTDQEFGQGLEFIKAIGQATVDDHNEVVLCADVLGFSTLVTLLNTADRTNCTPGALLGPFYRGNSPQYSDGGSIVAEGSPGTPLFVQCRVFNTDGKAVENATVDVWQASPVGLYENQDAEQPDMNLRGRFRTDANGSFRFRSVRPSSYPVPTHGPVGKLLEKQRRHPYRPAHLHFVVIADGYETLISQIFADDSDHLDSDVVFGVNRSLVGKFHGHEDGRAPALDVTGLYYTLEYDFVVAEGTPTYPTPPIK